MKQYLKFRSVYGESFSEIERITHTLEPDGITPVSVLDDPILSFLWLQEPLTSTIYPSM